MTRSIAIGAIAAGFAVSGACAGQTANQPPSEQAAVTRRSQVAAHAPAGSPAHFARVLTIPRGATRTLARLPPLGRFVMACSTAAEARVWFAVGASSSVVVTRASRGRVAAAWRAPGHSFGQDSAFRSPLFDVWNVRTWQPVDQRTATVWVATGPGALGSHACGAAIQGLVARVSVP